MNSYGVSSQQVKESPQETHRLTENHLLAARHPEVCPLVARPREARHMEDPFLEDHPRTPLPVPLPR